MVKCLIRNTLNAENSSIFCDKGVNVVTSSEPMPKNDKSTDRRQMNIPVEVERRSGIDRRNCAVPVEADRRMPKDVFTATETTAENDRRKTDRRQVNIPVNIERRKCDRRSIVSFTNDAQHQNNSEKKDILFEACEALPPLRRLKALPDQIEQGNGTTALGMASLALINLPEDWRDIKQSAGQIKALIRHEKFEPTYDYKNYQHPFSFFRGTLIDNWIKKNLQAHKKWAQWLAKKNISLDKTSLGENIVKNLNTEIEDIIETNIKNLYGINEKAFKYKGTFFGELTARAMRRTTLLGVMAMGLLEAPKIIKSITQGNTIKDKAVSTGKQGVKSAINVASVTAGIGYMGALGAKFGGPAGSLVGMGLGAVLGSKISQKAQDVID